MISIDLTGRNALVTGGTRGIGRAISRRLAQAGAATAAVYRGDVPTAQASLQERRAFGMDTRHENLQADIGDESQVEQLIADTNALFPDGLDFLVLNAGIGLHGPVATADPAAFRRILDVNLYAAFLLTRGLMPTLRRGGSIIAISSGAGHDPIPNLALYGASKAALNQFIADLAQETGPLGVRANVVSPGSTDTAFQGASPAPQKEPEAAVHREHNALRRQGVPDDVAGAVLFLCSDLAAFVTGQALRVNGGAI